MFDRVDQAKLLTEDHMRKVLGVLALLGPASLLASNDAGCGLGSLAFGDKNQKVYQILAVTLNATSYSQLFGITTGTSNCKADAWVMNEHQKEYFANTNMDALVVEMAQGKGEHLEAFAAIYGCSADQFGPAVQKNFSNIVSDNITGAQLIKNVDQVVGNQCSSLI